MSKTAIKTITTEANDVELAERRRYLIKKILEDVPKDVPLTDDDIQEELNMVRYGNKQGIQNRNWERDLALLAKAV
jgi:chorismate synthase